MTTYIPRELHRVVKSALDTMPVVVITGMRQTGKTTFLQNDPLFKEYRYVSLDDFASLQTALAQPAELVSSADRICIDEVQKAPELLSEVKRDVDRNRKPGRIMLSGSANFSLLKGISESLAGRAVYLTLQPFSRRELNAGTQKNPFLVDLLTGKTEAPLPDGVRIEPHEILRGGMPPVKDFSEDAASLWFRGFEQTYLERDIRDFARVDDILGFRTIIKFSALRTGQIMNFSQLARDARLSLTTAMRYVRLAETSFLFRRLAPFLRNRTSRLIKSPKLYVTDSGLACYLAGVDSLGDGDEEPLRGVLLETYALQNIASILEAYLPGAQLAFWHIQGRREVDLVIEYKKSCVAIEIKSSSRWSHSDLASLNVFLQKTPSCRAAILAYNGTQSSRLGPKLWALPMSVLIS